MDVGNAADRAVAALASAEQPAYSKCATWVLPELRTPGARDIGGLRTLSSRALSPQAVRSRPPCRCPKTVPYSGAPARTGHGSGCGTGHVGTFRGCSRRRPPSLWRARCPASASRSHSGRHSSGVGGSLPRSVQPTPALRPCVMPPPPAPGRTLTPSAKCLGTDRGRTPGRSARRARSAVPCWSRLPPVLLDRAESLTALGDAQPDVWTRAILRRAYALLGPVARDHGAFSPCVAEVGRRVELPRPGDGAAHAGGTTV